MNEYLGDLGICEVCDHLDYECYENTTMLANADCLKGVWNIQPNPKSCKLRETKEHDLKCDPVIWTRMAIEEGYISKTAAEAMIKRDKASQIQLFSE